MSAEHGNDAVEAWAGAAPSLPACTHIYELDRVLPAAVARTRRRMGSVVSAGTGAQPRRTAAVLGLRRKVRRRRDARRPTYAPSPRFTRPCLLRPPPPPGPVRAKTIGMRATRRMKHMHRRARHSCGPRAMLLRARARTWGATSSAGSRTGAGDYWPRSTLLGDARLFGQVERACRGGGKVRRRSGLEYTPDWMSDNAHVFRVLHSRTSRICRQPQPSRTCPVW
jgi:hypothetical protein